MPNQSTVLTIYVIFYKLTRMKNLRHVFTGISGATTAHLIKKNPPKCFNKSTNEHLYGIPV